MNYGPSDRFVLLADLILMYICMQESGLLLARHHQYHVPSNEDDPNSVRALETRVHQRDWIHPHEDLGRSPDSVTAQRVCCKAMQDQHEAATFCASNFMNYHVRSSCAYENGAYVWSLWSCLIRCTLLARTITKSSLYCFISTPGSNSIIARGLPRKSSAKYWSPK
jgi:hypothetical protein